MTWTLSRFIVHLRNNNSTTINKVNTFNIVLNKLSVWQSVLNQIDDEKERIHVIFEEIQPIFQLAMDFPYAIKSLLIFSTVDLFKILSRVLKQPIPKYDEHRLKAKTLILFKPLIEKQGWKAFDPFYKSLGDIDTEKFRNASNNFRIRTHHKIQPYVEIGQTPILGHWEDTDATGYTFGSERAVPLSKAIPLLANEHLRCGEAYVTFWNLIKEMIHDLSVLSPGSPLGL